ncbi:hypothetical protein Tco_0441525 [Tanacetum coccineum]
MESECYLLNYLGLEVGSIRRIQGLDTAYWGFLGVGTTLDIFQNIIFIPYFQYGVLVFSGYGVLSFIPLWSLEEHPKCCQAKGSKDEEKLVHLKMVVTSSSLEMLTNSCLGGIMVSLIFLEELKEEALVEFMVELFEEDEDGKKNEKDGLFNLKANDQSRKA